jgi:hypothetical protein
MFSVESVADNDGRIRQFEALIGLLVCIHNSASGDTVSGELDFRGSGGQRHKRLGQIIDLDYLA